MSRERMCDCMRNLGFQCLVNAAVRRRPAKVLANFEAALSFPRSR